MTSSYGYPRSLTNEEKLYLENQALQAELQRRDERKQGLKEAITGGLATGLGLGALGTGAVALGSILSPAQKAKIGKNLSSTVDLAKEGIDKARRSVASRVAPPEAPTPSRPAPTTSVERLKQHDDIARASRAEPVQGTTVLDLDLIQGEAQAIANLKRDFEAAARTEVADQFLARGVEPRAATGGLARPAVQPQDFLDEAVQEVSVKVLDQPGQTFGGAPAPAGLLEPISRSRKEAVYSAVAAKPESELPRVYKPSGGAEVELITDPNTGEIFRRGKSPESFSELYLQRQGYTDAGTLVDQQSLTAFDNADQTVAALQSGEDQATGRTMRAIQRNEDENIGAVNAAKDLVENQLAKVAIENPSVASTLEVDAAVNRVASDLVDGLPVDQAEGVTRSITPQEQVELAKQQMIARRQEIEALGLRPGTVRYERALAEPFRTSASTQMRGTGAVETALPAGPIRETVEAVSASEYLPERSVLNIGPQAQVTSTAAGTSIRGASPSYQNVPSKEETRQLFGTPDVMVPGAPNEMGQDIPGSARVRGIAPQLEEGEGLSKQEIVYSFLDRPAAPEVRGGSAGEGVYGLEPGYVPGAMSKATGEFSEAASRKPSYVPAWLQKKEAATGFGALTTEQVASGAEKARGGRVKEAFEAELGRRQASKERLVVSEAMRRARIEGRDPQAVLRSLGFGV